MSDSKKKYLVLIVGEHEDRDVHVVDVCGMTAARAAQLCDGYALCWTCEDQLLKDIPTPLAELINFRVLERAPELVEILPAPVLDRFRTRLRRALEVEEEIAKRLGEVPSLISIIASYHRVLIALEARLVGAKPA